MLGSENSLDHIPSFDFANLGDYIYRSIQTLALHNVTGSENYMLFFQQSSPEECFFTSDVAEVNVSAIVMEISENLTWKQQLEEKKTPATFHYHQHHLHGLDYLAV